MESLNPFAERVLDVVERIPPGKVMAYGDIAEYLGEGGPRQVGKVMSTWGGGVPWWRVVHADGSGAAPDHLRECLAHWRAEGTPLRGERVDMRLARWDGHPASGRPSADGGRAASGESPADGRPAASG